MDFAPTLERVMGIEPTRPAWKAGILPLNYTRMVLPLTSANGYYHIFAGLSMGFLKFSGPPPWKFGIPQSFVVQMPSPAKGGRASGRSPPMGFRSAADKKDGVAVLLADHLKLLGEGFPDRKSVV